MLRLVLRAQAVYYFVTGAWPLVSMRTFEIVTGPKTDEWLVRTVGLLTLSIAAALWVGARRRDDAARPPVEIVVLAALSAASFAAIDIHYSLAGRILPVYLGDAGVELALLAAVAAASYQRRRDA